MLIGLKSDGVVINYDNKSIYNQNVIIGLYDGKLSKNNKYQALVGLELLEYEGGVESETFATIER